MSDEPADLTLVYLRRIDSKVDRVLEDLRDLRHRTTSLERQSADLRGETVVPRYEVQDPAGAGKGATEGPPIPARAWADGQPATLRQAAVAAAAGLVAAAATGLARGLDPDGIAVDDDHAPALLDHGFFSGTR